MTAQCPGLAASAAVDVVELWWNVQLTTFYNMMGSPLHEPNILLTLRCKWARVPKFHRQHMQ